MFEILYENQPPTRLTKKNTTNVTSQKLKALEQSHWNAKFATRNS